MGFKSESIIDRERADMSTLSNAFSIVNPGQQPNIEFYPDLDFPSAIQEALSSPGKYTGRTGCNIEQVFPSSSRRNILLKTRKDEETARIEEKLLLRLSEQGVNVPKVCRKGNIITIEEIKGETLYQRISHFTGFGVMHYGSAENAERAFQKLISDTLLLTSRIDSL